MSHTCRIVFKIVNFSKTKCCHDYYDYFIVDCDTFMYVCLFEFRKNATPIPVTGTALPVPLGLNHGKTALH